MCYGTFVIFYAQYLKAREICQRKTKYTECARIVLETCSELALSVQLSGEGRASCRAVTLVIEGGSLSVTE